MVENLPGLQSLLDDLPIDFPNEIETVALVGMDNVALNTFDNWSVVPPPPPPSMIPQEEESQKLGDRFDVHLQAFYGDSCCRDAQPTPHSARIPVTKDRIITILSIPSRQIKRELDRSDILMIVFYVVLNLNCHATLQQYRLCEKSRKLIELLWDRLLPATLREYAHRDDVVVRFSPHAETFNKRCGILKVYFDQHLEEMCACVKANINYIRYIYSHVQGEVYFQTDEGLRTEREMSLLLLESGTVVIPLESDGGGGDGASRVRYTPYATISR